jgi:hypothetical protein
LEREELKPARGLSGQRIYRQDDKLCWSRRDYAGHYIRGQQTGLVSYRIRHFNYKLVDIRWIKILYSAIYAQELGIR